MSPYVMPGMKTLNRQTVDYTDVIKYFTERSAEVFGVKASDLTRAIRQRKIVEARQAAMYLIRNNSKHTLKEIAKAFGGKDHTTVIHSIATIKDLMRYQPDLRARVEKIQMDFYNRQPTVKSFLKVA